MGNTESVIIAVRKVVPQKSGAPTIDCAMNSSVMFDQRLLFYIDRFESGSNNALTWEFKRQPFSVNLSFEQGYPGIFHEIIDLSVHWLPAYVNFCYALHLWSLPMRTLRKTRTTLHYSQDIIMKYVNPQ